MTTPATLQQSAKDGPTRSRQERELSQHLPDALADALARVVVEKQLLWQRELDAVRSEARATIAELRVEILEYREQLRSMTEAAIAALPVPKDGNSVTIEDLQPSVEAAVAKAVAAFPVPKDGQDADLGVIAELIEETVAKAVSGLPVPKDGESVTVDQLRPSIDEAVAKAVSALPVPKDGESVTAEQLQPSIDEAVSKAVAALQPPSIEDLQPSIDEAVSKAVSALPAPKDGESVTVEDLQPSIDEAVAKAISALPVPKDGVSVTVEDLQPTIDDAVAKAVSTLKLPGIEDLQPSIEEAVTRAVSEIAERTAAPDELSASIEDAIAKAVAALPAPKDGQDADPKLIAGMVDEAVTRAVSGLTPAKDGVGLADALIDRDGALVLTLTNGAMKNLGRVVGRDVDDVAIARSIADAVSQWPKPKDGADGFGFEDMDCGLGDDGRTMVLRFARGDRSKEFSLPLAHVIDRGVWREGNYRKGDAVTWGGSLFIAQEDTAEKPETGTGWRLAVKRGRDGRAPKAASAPTSVRLR